MLHGKRKSEDRRLYVVSLVCPLVVRCSMMHFFGVARSAIDNLAGRDGELNYFCPLCNRCK